ncbi:MAG: hypothetical protein HY401_05290 [Elusimicrobia bacterium]|nr:hypothetical protein [Elusimicrobiota bacterium]
MRGALAVFLVSCSLINGWFAAFAPADSPEELPQAFAASRGAVGGTRDLVLVGLGLRRLACDMAMLDLLIYYGTQEESQEDWHQAAGRGRATRFYPDLLPLTRRIIGLDPYFRYAVLYGAGALAFNENRYGEAVFLLQEALKRDPGYWPYSLNLSAIAYKNRKNFPELIYFLEKVYPLPECPTMLKNILANIYLRAGQKEKARSIFHWMAQSAPESEYREHAKGKLKILESAP